MNGGKHTAMNFSHPYINGDLVVIVDSDDILTPDAIATIHKDWEIYKDNDEIGVLSYSRRYKDGNLISNNDAPDYYIDDDITYRVNKNITGDRCEVVRTDVFKSFELPTFAGEKFMSEGWLWRAIALKYKTVYIHKAIYQGEYLEGGLSQSGRLFRMNNPYGMMENCRSFFIPQVKKSEQIKQTLAFGVYGLCANLSGKEIVKSSGVGSMMYAVLPLSYLLFKHWSRINGYKKRIRNYD
jgi:glycosyltransferase involved in cell wall biosynthesis